MSMNSGRTRREHDLIGERDVPADAYYGVHTLRALENFPITGTAISIYSDLVTALACVKQAAALALTKRSTRVLSPVVEHTHCVTG